MKDVYDVIMQLCRMLTGSSPLNTKIYILIYKLRCTCFIQDSYFTTIIT